MSDMPEAIAASAPADHGCADVGSHRAIRRISLAFLGLVAFCLFVPLIQTLDPVVPEIVPPVDEHRQPTPFPPLRLLLNASGDFATELNTWFDDRVGFRDLFIRSKNQIDYSLFYTSRKVYIGKDAWLFGHDQAALPLARLDPSDFAELEDSFVGLAERLREKGVRLIVIGYPDKSVIYPEMTPPEMPLIPSGGNYDHLREFLAAQASLTFIDAEPILRREKSLVAERLYAKEDIHATQVAQLPVVREIVARIAQIEGRSDIRWDRQLTLSHVTVSDGIEGRMLSLLAPVAEADIPRFKGIDLVGDQEPDGQWILPDPRVLNSADDGVGRPFDWEFRSRPELCPQRLPGTVLFGNSFSDYYWMLGLHHYFCFIRRARDPMSRFALFFNTMPSDTKYFIFEYYAPWLPYYGPPKN
jgi:hypothetical protein